MAWITVLRTGPDRSVRPVQPGTGANSVRLKAPKPAKIGQKLDKIENQDQNRLFNYIGF